MFVSDVSTDFILYQNNPAAYTNPRHFITNAPGLKTSTFGPLSRATTGDAKSAPCRKTPRQTENYDKLLFVKTVLFLVPPLLLGAVASVTAAEVTLRSVAELNDFTEDTSRRFTPFCITGTVQATFLDAALIVNDASGWTEINNLSTTRPKSGDQIVLTGRAHMSSHHEPDFAAAGIEILGKGSVTPPIATPISDLTEERHHLRQIITEGTVIDTFPDEVDAHNHFLIIKDDAEILPVALHVDSEVETDLEHLRDARIRAIGRFMHTASGIRKYSGSFIAVDDRQDITVIDPAPNDPFDAPPLEKTLYRTPREIAGYGRRSVVGEALAVWNGNRVMLRTDDQRIVNLTLAHGQPAPNPGENITVAGYPETDLFRINLTRTLVRTNVRNAVPVTETAITDLATVFNGIGGPNAVDSRCHGRLMRIRGVVQSIPAPNAVEPRLLLACGTYKLSVDLGNHPDAAADIDLGTVLEVTGRCLLETDSWTPDDIFPRIHRLVIVIRAPDDLSVITSPSWWTPVRLLVVISLLLAALIGVYIWNRVLQKLVNRRGRELYREQVAHAIAEFKTGERTRLAVELHDSLSQTLAGIACQVAAGAKTLDRNPSVARRCIETADKMLNSCRTELRQCLFDLRSDTLEEPDFSVAIRKTLDQLDSDAAVAIRFNVPRSRLKDTTAHAILSIIRELTGNAIRHGGATDVKVAGAIEDDRILFSVRDNGQGFDPATSVGPLQGHFGLEGIRNRIQKFNGTFTIDSKPGFGAKAVISIPLPRKKGEYEK